MKEHLTEKQLRLCITESISEVTEALRGLETFTEEFHVPVNVATHAASAMRTLQRTIDHLQLAQSRITIDAARRMSTPPPQEVKR